MANRKISTAVLLSMAVSVVMPLSSFAGDGIVKDMEHGVEKIGSGAKKGTEGLVHGTGKEIGRSHV